MSWQSRSDPGLAIVAQVHDALKVADRWRIDEPRGFTWWASDYAQRIWADQSVFHNTTAVFRLHAEIEFLRGRGHAQKCEVYLSQLMSRASLSALVYDEAGDTFKLHCSVYACEENADWLGRLFLAAVGLQVADAHCKAPSLATDLKSAAAATAHPKTGLRDEPDPMCAAVERFFKPAGQQPSRWENVEEWEEAQYNVKRLAQKVSTDSCSFLHAEFAWTADQNESINLEVTTQRPHPDLGNGLRLSLVLPVEMAEENAAHTALELNAAERKEWKWIHDLGSWCCENGAVEYNCFVPNVSYNKAVLPALVHEMAIRADWASELAASELASAAQLS
jgi:hypothetical protein